MSSGRRWTELEMEAVCRLMFQLGFHTRLYSDRDDRLFAPLAGKMGRSVGAVKSEMAYYQRLAGLESVQRGQPSDTRQAVFQRVLGGL